MGLFRKGSSHSLRLSEDKSSLSSNSFQLNASNPSSVSDISRVTCSMPAKITIDSNKDNETFLDFNQLTDDFSAELNNILDSCVQGADQSSKNNLLPMIEDTKMNQSMLYNISEFIITEITFYRKLLILYQIFYLPIQKSNLIGPRQLDYILPRILDLNILIRNFLLLLKENIYEKEDFYPSFLESLHKYFCIDYKDELIKVCSEFCKLQNISLSKLKTWRSFNKKLDTLILSIESNPQLERLKLEDYMASVYQRFMKYPLFLNNFIDLTEENTNEFNMLREIKSSIREILKYIENEIETSENEHKMKLLMLYLEIDYSKDGNNDTNNHKIIHESAAELCHKIKKNIAVKIVITDKFLLLFKNDNLTYKYSFLSEKLQKLYPTKMALNKTHIIMLSDSDLPHLHIFYEDASNSQTKKMKLITPFNETNELRLFLVRLCMNKTLKNFKIMNSIELCAYNMDYKQNTDEENANLIKYINADKIKSSIMDDVCPIRSNTRIHLTKDSLEDIKMANYIQIKVTTSEEQKLKLLKDSITILKKYVDNYENSASEEPIKAVIAKCQEFLN